MNPRTHLYHIRNSVWFKFTFMNSIQHSSCCPIRMYMAPITVLAFNQLVFDRAFFQKRFENVNAVAGINQENIWKRLYFTSVWSAAKYLPLKTFDVRFIWIFLIPFFPFHISWPKIIDYSIRCLRATKRMIVARQRAKLYKNHNKKCKHFYFCFNKWNLYWKVKCLLA